jgi:hypothetical protein
MEKTLTAETLRSILDSTDRHHGSQSYVMVGSAGSSAMPVAHVAAMVVAAGFEATADELDRAVEALGGERLRHTNLNRFPEIA